MWEASKRASLADDLYERREFILDELKSGKLKNKPILYYKELGEPSHATALDYLINEYDWSTVSEKPEGIDQEQWDNSTPEEKVEMIRQQKEC